MLNIRKFAQIVILLIVGGLSLVLAGGLLKGKIVKKSQEAPQPESSQSEMKLTDIEFTEMEQGKQFWTLRASEAVYFHDRQMTKLKSVHLTFHLENDEGEVILESSEGVLYSGTKNIELRKDVRATLPRGYVLLTDSADYDHLRRMVSSESAIRVFGPGGEVDGSKWEYQIGSRTAHLAKVKASLIMSKLRLGKN